MSKLTHKQRAFVDEYMKDFNATQAALRAGYSPKSARTIGPENLSKPVIDAEIERRVSERAMGANELLIRLGERARFDLSPFVREVDRPGSEYRVYVDVDALIAAGMGHMIRGVKQTTSGPVIEFTDPDAAQQLLAKQLGLLRDQIDINTKMTGEFDVSFVDYRADITEAEE